MVDTGTYLGPDRLKAHMDWEFLYTYTRPGKLEVKRGDRLWIATGNRWMGYFVIYRSKRLPDGRLRVWYHRGSWRKVDGGRRPPFHAFTREVPRR